MRLLNCEVSNFGSYAKLDFDFSRIGLALLHGNTGAGKSTFLDVACWILYGITAKNGNADEVRSWQNTNDPTVGILKLTAADEKEITVIRKRGRQNQNDLYWVEAGEVQERRGKDLSDTQELLDARLGLSASLYIAGSYFHEFSETNKFFTTGAKYRRAIFEKVANLDLASSLSAASLASKKDTKEELIVIKEKNAKLEGMLEHLKKYYESTKKQEEAWDAQKEATIELLRHKASNFSAMQAIKVSALQKKYNEFDITRAQNIASISQQIKELESNKKQCSMCGHVSGENQNMRSALARRLEKEEDNKNPFGAEIDAAQKESNKFEYLVEEETRKQNPHLVRRNEYAQDIENYTAQLEENSAQIKASEYRLNSLSSLQDLSASLRGHLVEKVMNEIQESTNRCLDKHFDSEIKVQFVLEDSDNLEVLIQKNGFDCVYTQLSKGQRALLKLAFSISVMRAASNKVGIHFSNLFFDEALDGLDTQTKTKAFHVFQELSQTHENIIIVDHCEELKECFDSRYLVETTGDLSYLSKE